MARLRRVRRSDPKERAEGGHTRQASPVPKAKLAEYRRKRDPKKTPEPFGGKTARTGLPIFVVQRHDARGASTTTSGSSETVRSPAGPCRRARRSSPGSSTSPSTSRTTRSSTRRSRARSRRASTAPARSRSGTSGTYELVEEKKNGGLTVRLHGERLEGHMDARPGQALGRPEELADPAQEGRLRARGTQARSYRPMLATPGEATFRRGDWLLRGRSGTATGSWPRSPAARPTLAHAQGPGLHEALRERREGARQGGEDPGLRRRRRGLRARRGRAAELLGDAAGKAGDADRLLRLRPARGRRRAARSICRSRSVGSGSRSSSTSGTRQSATRRPSTTAMRCSRRRSSSTSKGSWPSAWARSTSPEGAHATGSRSRAHGEQEFVVAGYTRGQGRRQGTLGSLVLATYERGDLVYAGNVGTGFSDREIDRLLSKLKPLERKTPPFTEVPKMPAVRKGDVVWVEPKLVAEVVFAEWTHDGHLRAPSYQGLREDKDATEVRREGPEPDRSRPRSARASASSSRRTWTSSSGRTRESRRATCSSTTAGSRRSSIPHLDGPAVHDEALPGRVAGQVLLPEGRAEGHARLDPDGLDRRHDAGQAAAAPADRRAARQRRARAALDGEHGLHRPERVVLADRQARRVPTGCSSTSIRRPTSASRRRSRSRCSSSRRSRRSSWRASSRRAAPRASTSSSRSRGGTRTRTRASSRRSSPARSRARTAGSSRPSGRGRSGAAC